MKPDLSMCILQGHRKMRANSKIALGNLAMPKNPNTTTDPGSILNKAQHTLRLGSLNVLPRGALGGNPGWNVR